MELPILIIFIINNSYLTILIFRHGTRDAKVDSPFKRDMFETLMGHKNKLKL